MSPPLLGAAIDLAIPRHPPHISAALSDGEKAYDEAVERYKYSDWAREQEAEPASNAGNRYISLRPSVGVLDGFLDHFALDERPRFSRYLISPAKVALH